MNNERRFVFEKLRPTLKIKMKKKTKNENKNLIRKLEMLCSWLIYTYSDVGVPCVETTVLCHKVPENNLL